MSAADAERHDVIREQLGKLSGRELAKEGSTSMPKFSTASCPEAVFSVVAAKKKHYFIAIFEVWGKIMMQDPKIRSGSTKLGCNN